MEAVDPSPVSCLKQGVEGRALTLGSRSGWDRVRIGELRERVEGRSGGACAGKEGPVWAG